MQDQRNVLITGGARRIGRAIALDMASRGARIALHYRSSRADAEQTQRDIIDAGGTAELFQADLSNTDDIVALVNTTADYLDGIDTLVLSAAIYRKTPWRSLTVDDWDDHMNINLRSTFVLTKQAADYMNDDSCMVLFSDWAGLRPYVNYLPYCVSKAAVAALTTALAQTLAPRIRVNCICPGTVLPPDDASPAALDAIVDSTPLKRVGRPEDIAAAVRFLSEDTNFATGSILTLDGGRLVANSKSY